MNEQWNKALEQVEDQYLLEAAEYRRRRHWPRVAAAAAAALVMAISWSVLCPEPTPPPPVIDGENSTEPPETQSSVSPEPTEDVAAVAPDSAPGGGFWDWLAGGSSAVEQTPTYSSTMQKPSKPEQAYNVRIANDYPIENQLNDSYAPGETVTVKLKTVTEHSYILSANGIEQQMDTEASDLTYTYFTFTMPYEDVLIEIEEIATCP